jgi:hypothetical protein
MILDSSIFDKFVVLAPKEPHHDTQHVGNGNDAILQSIFLCLQAVAPLQFSRQTLGLRFSSLKMFH